MICVRWYTYVESMAGTRNPVIINAEEDMDFFWKTSVYKLFKKNTIFNEYTFPNQHKHIF